MPQSPDVQAFPDCRSFMDKAIEAKKGFLAIFPEKGQAESFRLRCYTARSREKQQNKKLFDKDDAMYGKSVWDSLTFRVGEAGARWAVAAVHDEEAALQAAGVELREIE